MVVIGGGFAGLEAARALGRAPVRVTLVDRRNHHLFQPLLYQVATAALSPAEIAAPIRGVLRRQRNVEVVLGEAAEVDSEGRAVILTNGERLPYDYAVIATGATHHYFGHDEWAPLAPGLKTVEDALEIRRRFFLAFEAAERSDDPETRAALLTFVVVGAGPTGVELAGAMAEIARHSLPRDFRRIDTRSARILLLEGLPRVLPGYPEELSARARRDLERLGVEVRTGSLVTRVEPGGVCLGEERVRARNVVWAAGVQASPLGRTLGGERDRAGRLRVEPDLSLPGRSELFVAGDLALSQGQGGDPLPGLAPVAQQQGRHAARMIVADLRGEPRRPFHYRDRGVMATIGRGKAVAVLGQGWRVAGPLAWLAWLLVHIASLIGFRNRLLVLIQWAWAYLTWRRGAWLITGRVGSELAPPDRPLGEPSERENGRSGAGGGA